MATSARSESPPPVRPSGYTADSRLPLASAASQPIAPLQSNPISAYLLWSVQVMGHGLSQAVNNSPGAALAYGGVLGVSYLGKFISAGFTVSPNMPRFVAMAYLIHTALSPIFKFSQRRETGILWGFTIQHLNPLFIAFFLARKFRWDVQSVQNILLTGGVLIIVKSLQHYIQNGNEVRISRGQSREIYD